MIVGGAGRHAIEIYDILEEEEENLAFFNDIDADKGSHFLNRFPVIRSVEEAAVKFKSDPRFILGLGGVKGRQIVAHKLEKAGGVLTSVVAKNSSIGKEQVMLGIGINIMKFVMISSCTEIGNGTLINAFVSIHHDVQIGKFCEIAPHATLLGGVKVADNTLIGSGSVVLPNVHIGENAIVGAGAVVTKDVAAHTTVMGVPAVNYKANNKS